MAKTRPVDTAAWADAFREDLRHLASLAQPRALTSIYFGGGTPSLIPPEVAEAVFKEADALFGLEPGAEVTVEANPDDAHRFSELKSLGFTRLSLGVQSLSDDALTFLGRNHDSAMARRAIDAACTLFDQVSLDFIYALPDQNLHDWAEALEDIAGLGAGHLSLYQLTIEPGTAFGKAAARGRLIPMPDDRSAEFYEETQAITAALGFPAYEISNHAQKGEEAVHNALYWAEADWLALGPGAHGRLGPGDQRLATSGLPRASAYPNVERRARLTVEALSLEQHLMEVLNGGLRPVAGLELARLGAAAPAVLTAAKPLIDGGYLRQDEQRLAATPRGRLVLDHLAAELALALPSSD